MTEKRACPADVENKVLLKTEVPRRTEIGRIARNKPQPKADGPFEVIGATSHTGTIIRDVLTETITRDRVSKKSVPGLARIISRVDHDMESEDGPPNQPAAGCRQPAH